MTTLEASFASLSTGTGATISYVDTAVANSTASLASRVVTLESDYTSLNSSLSSKASISYVDTTVASSTSSLASSVSTLQTTVSGHTTSITSQATSINGLSAKYGVTINNNGAITGYQINSEASGRSDFTILADNFSIYTSGGAKKPFSVSGSTVSVTGDLDISGALTTGNTTDGVKTTKDGIVVYAGGVARIKLGNLSVL
jgi:hypothetical protein